MYQEGKLLMIRNCPESSPNIIFFNMLGLECPGRILFFNRLGLECLDRS